MKKISEQDIQTIFNKWNSHKGFKWKSHREITPEIKLAIREVLRQGYTLIQICEAIDNYAVILLGRDYTWSYAWTLYQFLLRSRPDNRKEKQFWRFLNNNFVVNDYLSKEAIKAKIAARKYQEFIKEIQEEEKVRKSITEEDRQCFRKKIDTIAKPKSKTPVLTEEEFEKRKQEQIARLRR